MGFWASKGILKESLQFKELQEAKHLLPQSQSRQFPCCCLKSAAHHWQVQSDSSHTSRHLSMSRGCVSVKPGPARLQDNPEQLDLMGGIPAHGKVSGLDDL